MPQEYIHVKGAREHNLKNIDVTIPRDKLVVVTGVSGSGKSSLAFDTIYAEGQRRYVESLSAYARQFLGRMEKPDVEYIEGLSPAISIDQKGVSHNPRSTVGTVTEIYDYLRLLFARVGHPHCPKCGRPVERQTVQQIVDAILNLPEDSRIMIMAPKVRRRKGEHKEVFEEARKAGFVRVRVNGDHPPAGGHGRPGLEQTEVALHRDSGGQADSGRRHGGQPGGRLGGDCPPKWQRRGAGGRAGKRGVGVLRALRMCPLRDQPPGDRAPHLQLQQSPRSLLSVYRTGVQAGRGPRPYHTQQGALPW